MPAHNKSLENVCYPFLPGVSLAIGMGLFPLARAFWFPCYRKDFSATLAPACTSCWSYFSVSDYLPSRSSWPQRRKKNHCFGSSVINSDWQAWKRSCWITRKKPLIIPLNLSVIPSVQFILWQLPHPPPCFNCLFRNKSFWRNVFSNKFVKAKMLTFGKLSVFWIWAPLPSTERLGITLAGKPLVMATNRGAQIPKGETNFWSWILYN